MYKYSLVLLAASAVLFSGCGEGECCQSGELAPVAVIAGLTNGSFTGTSFPLSRTGSSDSDGTTVAGDDIWTVDGGEVPAGHILSEGTHNVCLTVTDDDGYTNQTCGTVIITAVGNVRPVARVGVPNTKCEPGNPVSINSAGSGDTDGSISSYNWNQPIGNVANGQVTCPAYGQSLNVCLKVTDNQGLESLQVCESVNAVEAPTTVVPVAIIEKGDPTGDDGQYFVCSNVHDGDNIITIAGDYPYGSNIPKDIKEVTWSYTYFKADGTIEDGPNVKTQSQYNGDGGHADGSCVKWFHLNDDVSTISLSVTVEDNDGETSSKSYLYTKATDALVEQ